MKRPIRYPFDKSGRSPNNFIQDEPHQLTPGRDRRIIVPLYIPFYSKSVIITDVATGLQVDSSDFYTADFDETIQRKTGKEVASTIIITNKAISDNVTISYQHVGGVESLVSGNVIREQLNALANDARPIVFDAIIGKPKGYPALPHMHDIGDVYGMEYIVYAIDRLRDAIANGDLNKWLSLYNYIDQQDDNLLQLILKNKADIAETKQQVAVVQDNLDYLSMKIYGTKDKLATKVIKSFMPVSPRIGNRLAWDEHYGGYYLGYRNVEYWRVFVDNVEGTDVPMDVDPNHGTEPTKPYKTIKFALEQRKEAKGFLLFLLKARQEHVLPGNMNIKMKGGQEFVFDTYTYDGGVIRSGINYETYKQDLAQIHGLDSLQSYIRDTAATLVIGDLTDSNDPDGFGYTHPRILFELESLLEECLVWFRNIKLHVKNWNRNVILQRVEESSLPEPIKQKARDRVEREVSGSSMTPLFKIPRICFRGCHVITDIQNRENDKFHSLFWNEPYIVVEWANRFSGKIMDMFQVMDVKTDIMFTDPDKVFVDDGTRCTDPTPISLSMVYLIDHLDYGDGHHHWINIRSNIYPDYSGSDALYLSEDYLAGTVSCEPYKLNPLGTPRGNNNDNTDKSIGIPYRDRFGRIYIKSLEDNKYYQIYPAIWHGDQLFPGVDSIQGSVRISLTYRHRDYGGNHGLRDEFLAFDDRKTTINQVWPAVWQDLKDPIPKKELESNTNPPVSQRAYVFFDKTKNRWYISTLDKTVKRIVYPAIWEPGRNLGETVRYQREAHMGTYFGKFDASAAPLSYPNTGGGGVTDPDPSNEWSLGEASYEFLGDYNLRAYRKNVEVLRRGSFVRTEKSDILQYTGCDSSFANTLSSMAKPHPSIDNKGTVTWDYGNINRFDSLDQITTPYGNHNSKYLSPSAIVFYGDKFWKRGFWGVSTGALLVDPYIAVKYPNEIKQLTGSSTLNYDNLERIGRSSDYKVKPHISPKNEDLGVIVVRSNTLPCGYPFASFIAALDDTKIGVTLQNSGTDTVEQTVKNPVVSTTSAQTITGLSNYHSLPGYCMTEYNGHIFVYIDSGFSGYAITGYNTTLYTGRFNILIDVIPNTRVRDLPNFGSNFYEVLVDPKLRRLKYNDLITSRTMLSNLRYHAPMNSDINETAIRKVLSIPDSSGFRTVGRDITATSNHLDIIPRNKKAIFIIEDSYLGIVVLEGTITDKVFSINKANYYDQYGRNGNRKAREFFNYHPELKTQNLVDITNPEVNIKLPNMSHL